MLMYCGIAHFTGLSGESSLSQHSVRVLLFSL